MQGGEQRPLHLQAAVDGCGMFHCPSYTKELLGSTNVHYQRISVKVFYFDILQ